MSSRKSISREVRRILYGSASVLAGLSLAGTVLAQETEGGVLEEVVVRGIRASFKASLDTKRNADTVVEAITAEDIGKFPDKNVAESLQRLTGIALSRDYGEGERVTIRGTAPNLNLTQLNSHAIATSDWFILDQLAATRSFNYLMLPSDIVGELQVFKSSRADIEEGGIGGTINVKTRNPLDLEPMTLSVSTQGVHTALADETDPQASALFSWKNDSESVGILVAGLYQERHIRRDGIEVLNYSDRVIGGETVATPDLIGSALFQQERTRQGANFGVQFRPNDRLDFNLTGLYTELTADNFNQNYLAWFVNKFGAGEVPTDITVTPDGTLAGGTFATTATDGMVFDGIVREARTEARSIDLDVNFAMNDKMSWHGEIGFTDAKGETENQPFWEVNTDSGFTWDFTNGVPQVEFTIDETDAAAPVLGWTSHNQILNDDEEFYAYTDLKVAIDRGPFNGLQFGLKYTDHERVVGVTYGQTRPLFGATACGGGPCGLDDVAGGLTPSDFLSDIGGSGVLRNYRQMNPDAITAIYRAQEFVTFDPNNPEHTDPLPSGAPGWTRFFIYHLGPLESFTVAEEAIGGYAMATFGGEDWRGNVGVRAVMTDQESIGWNVGVPAGTPGAIANPFGLITPLSIKNDYSDILPSFNISFDLSEDLVLRFAAARVMARPDYNSLAPTITSTTALTLTGTGGNPLLDPYRADQFDVTTEWYFGPESLLSLQFFYKDLQSYLVTGAGPERLPVDIPDPNDGRLDDPEADCQSTTTPGLYNCIFTIDRPVNGSGGRNQGVEIAYQQPIWGGFGAQVNYTYSDAETAGGEPIAGNSEHTGNLTVYYENPRFGARLSYNKRSDFFVGLDRGRPLHSDDIESLDASFSFNVTDNIQLTADLLNLTDYELFQYYDNNPGRPGRFYDNDRTYYLGARMNFGL